MGVMKNKEEASHKIKDLERFDYSMLRTLHKLGEGKCYYRLKFNLFLGGFGVVRAAKMCTEAPNKPTKYLAIPGRTESPSLSYKSTEESTDSPPSSEGRINKQKRVNSSKDVLKKENTKSTLSTFKKPLSRSNSGCKVTKVTEKLYAMKIIGKDKVISTR